ncbi:MAG: hypothetical protein U0575_12670 [Phycisphaerales bacterium]
MLKNIVALYRRFDRAAQRRGTKVALSIVALVATAAILFPIVQAASRFASMRSGLLAEIQGKSIVAKDPAALQLRDFGTVSFNGRDYGGAEIKSLGELLFDASGQVNAPARLVDLMLVRERPRWAPEFLLQQAGTLWFVALVLLAWLQIIVWVGLVAPFTVVVLATAAVATPLLALGATGGAVAVGGIGLLTFSFVLLLRLLLLALQWPAQPFAVAHTVVKEAVRLNISLAFIIVLLVALPLIPLWIDAAQPLRYQVQTFISRSLTLTYVAAACMTLLLSCATVSFEIRDRQIWQLMTKPLGRLRYLVGKFIGVAALNVVLLAICGISIFVFVQYLRTRPAADMFDAAAVRDEVLTARSDVRPVYQPLSRDELIKKVDDAIANDSILKAEIETGQRSEADARRALAVKMQTEHLARQRQVAPGEKKTFVFHGLSRARALGAPITLRYLFYCGTSDSHETHPVIFEFAGLETPIARKYVPAQSHVLSVPSSVVQPSGDVELSIYNMGFDEMRQEFYPAQYTITFDAKDFELLYKVADFEWNFARAMVVLWIKLAFLAMLGVCAATFLSFPVACILSFTVFLIGSMAPFIAESLEYWNVDSAWRVDQMTVVGIATGSEWLLRTFGSLRPTQALVEGRLIPVKEVLMALFVVGVVWCGVVLVAGWLAFRRRELAIYSGQG